MTDHEAEGTVVSVLIQNNSMKTRVGMEVEPHSFFTSGIDRNDRSTSLSGLLTPGKRTRIKTDQENGWTPESASTL